MGAFEYQALDLRGRTVKGVIEGDAERQVRSALRDKGLMPLRVDVIRAGPAVETPGGLGAVGYGSAGYAATRQFHQCVLVSSQQMGPPSASLAKYPEN